jgi:hypothetical protein
MHVCKNKNEENKMKNKLSRTSKEELPIMESHEE